MKENITEEQRQMIIKYRNDYINAIEEMIKMYIERKHAYCPLCIISQRIVKLEYAYNHNYRYCYCCLWWILENTICVDWLDNTSPDMIKWGDVKVGRIEEHNNIRLKRIIMLREWLEVIKKLK